MKASISKKITFLTAFSFISLYSFAESFRTAKINIIDIQQQSGFESQQTMGTNEVLVVKLPEDREFIDAIELKFDIPEQIAYWQDCVACSVYNQVSPAPASNQIDYTATRQFVQTLPGKLSWVLQIPFTKDSSLKSNQYITKMDSVYDASTGYCFIRIQPVMKGVPEETLNSKINITVKPVLSDKGKLQIKLTGENSLKPYTIYIDDNLVNLKNNQILLEKGIHNISVVSQDYRNEVRTVRIEQAKLTEISIPLKNINPSVIVTAPEGARITIDEKPYKAFGTETEISEGEHKILFTIGDYQVLRTLSAVKGKTYKINCLVDLSIEEN